jgi:hypothetical protein
MTLVLLIVETFYIYVALPETRGKGVKSMPNEKASGTEKAISPRRATTAEGRISLLQKLRKAHFLFLATFSGAKLVYYCSCASW